MISQNKRNKKKKKKSFKKTTDDKIQLFTTINIRVNIKQISHQINIRFIFLILNWNQKDVILGSEFAGLIWFLA